MRAVSKRRDEVLGLNTVAISRRSPTTYTMREHSQVGLRLTPRSKSQPALLAGAYASPSTATPTQHSPERLLYVNCVEEPLG
jgi:hypothetical protein